MNMKKLILVALATSFYSVAAFAVGDAGCGLGHLVWQSKNGKLAQISAATTNGTSWSQSFGITTGTSGCTSHGLVRADKEQEYFANVNRDALYREMAQGSGDAVAGLAAVMGCTDVAAFTSFTQSKYEIIFPTANTSGEQMLTNLVGEMGNNPQLAQKCSRLVAFN